MNDPVKMSINRVTARWLISMGLTENQVAGMLHVSVDGVRYRLEPIAQPEEDAPASALQLEMIRRLCAQNKGQDSLSVENVKQLGLPISLRPKNETEATEAIHVLRHASRQEFKQLKFSALVILKGQDYMARLIECLNIPMERMVTLAMKDCMQDKRLKTFMEQDFNEYARKPKPRSRRTLHQ